MDLNFKEIASEGDMKGVAKINDNFDQVKQKFAEVDTKNTVQKISWIKDPSYTGKITYFDVYRRGNVVNLDGQLEVTQKGGWINAIRGLPRPPRDTATPPLMCTDIGTIASMSVQSGGVLSLHGNAGDQMKFPATLTFHMTYLTID